MFKIAVSIFSLLFGTALLLTGIGLQGTLVGLRASYEQFSVTMIGLVMSAYFVGYLFGSYLFPPVIRRVGHIRAYSVIATIASAASIAYILFVNPIAWLFLRVVIGGCMMGLYMIIESWLNELTPNETRGRVFAIYMLVTLLAMAAGQLILMTDDISGYRLFAMVSILISMALVPISLTRIRQPEEITTEHLELRKLYRISPLGVVGTLISGVVMGGFWGMAPLYGIRIGLSTDALAIFMTAAIVGGALLQWPVGRISDSIDRRIILAGSAALGALLALLLFFLSDQMPFWLFLTVTFVLGGFMFSLYSLSVAYTNDHLPPAQTLAASRGLLLLYGVGSSIGPAIAGRSMVAWGPGSLMLFFTTVLTVLMIYALIRIMMREPPAEETRGEFVAMTRTSSQALELVTPAIDQNDARTDPHTGEPPN